MIKCLCIGPPCVMRAFNKTVIHSIEQDVPKEHLEFLGWYVSEVKLENAEDLEDTDKSLLHKTFKEAEEESNKDSSIHAVFEVDSGLWGMLATKWLVTAVDTFIEAVDHSNKKYNEACN